MRKHLRFAPEVLCSATSLPGNVGPPPVELMFQMYDMQGAEQRAAAVQQRAERARKEANPLNHPLVQKYFQR